MQICSTQSVTVKRRDRALDSCIAGESDWTGAHRLVIDSLADGIDAARADAWISAFLREAGSVTGTIRINDALGIDANRDAVPHSALAIVVAR